MKLAKTSQQVIISASVTRGLTKGEVALLKLMRAKIVENKGIIIDDIIEIWTKNVQRTKGYQYYSSVDGKLCTVIHGDYYIETQSKAWFRRSIGSLVLKARLVVLPVIDI